MRFTTWQEQGDGADLGYNRLPDDIDESMMAATGDLEALDQSCIDEMSMISNLPLLFADGYPTSLDKITMPQLERFITFMVQCSFGHDTAKVTGEPQWWPKEVKFSNPFRRPRKINDNWMGNLKKLVFRCYTYHRSEYLLRFCSHLAQHPRDKLQYVNNWDSTTSLYHKSTGKLLVTFRNENMNYDKKIESPRRLLMPRIGSAGPVSKTKQPQQQQQQPQTMVQPVLCDDIYLCDNCDAELVGLQKMKEHEKLCYDREQSSERTRPASPDISVTDGSQPVQNQFLEYFNLISNDAKHLPQKSVEPTSDDNVAHRSSRRMRGCVNLARCPTIPFSSPAGIAMAKKLRTMTEVTQQERLERIERYLIAPALTNLSSRPRWLDRYTEFNRWIVTYKAHRDRSASDWVHEYKFNSFKGKPVLSIRSQILCVACRTTNVPITLLTPRQIAELKQDPDKYARPVRKCSGSSSHATALKSGSESISLRSRSESTILRSGTEGTALKSETEGTALKSGTQGTALKSESESTALKSGSESTALKSESESTALKSGSESTALKSGSESTALKSGSDSTAWKSESESMVLKTGSESTNFDCGAETPSLKCSTDIVPLECAAETAPVNYASGCDIEMPLLRSRLKQAIIPGGPKRKTSGDASTPIVIDDEDCAITSSTEKTEISSESRNESSVGPLVKRVRRSLPIELARLPGISITAVGNSVSSTIPPMGANLDVGQVVAVIDLCSSDEEDTLHEINTSDENRDPMRGTHENVPSSVTNNCLPAKNVYPSNPTSGWLNRISEPCATVLNAENTDSNANRYSFGEVTYKKRPCYSPGLRPTP